MVANNQNLDLFNEFIHDSVFTVRNSVKAINPFSLFHYEDLIDNKLLASLKPEFAATVLGIKDCLGGVFPTTKLLSGIRRRLISDNVGDVNTGYFNQVIKRQKDQKNITVIPSESDEFNYAFCIDLVTSFGHRLDPLHYDNQKDKERIRLWKPRGVTLNVRLPLVENDGTITELPINLDDTITVTEEDDTTTDMAILHGWRLENSEGQDLPLQHETDHAYVMDNRLKELVFKILINTPGGPRPTTKLFRDRTFARGVEFSYNLDRVFNSHYVFQLDMGTVTKNRLNPFVTELNGDYITYDDEAAIQADIRFKNNYRVYFIDVQDPILHYFLDGTRTVRMKMNTFNTDALGDKNNKSLPIIADDLPPYIILVPTDTTRSNPMSVISELSVPNPDESNIFRRELTYVTHFDPAMSTPGLHHLVFEEEIMHPKPGIQGVVESRAIGLTYGATTAAERDVIKNRYVSGSQPALKKTAIRQLREVIVDKSDFVLIGGGLTTWDALKHLDAREIYELNEHITDAVINELESGGFNTDTPLFQSFKKGTRLPGFTRVTSARKDPSLPAQNVIGRTETINTITNPQDLTEAEKIELETEGIDVRV